jgi:hypothetical protein
MVCPSCGSPWVQKVSVIVAEGTQHTRQSGGGLTVGRAAGHGGVGYTGISLKGTSQTELARAFSPPKDRAVGAVGWIIVLGLTMIGAFSVAYAHADDFLRWSDPNWGWIGFLIGFFCLVGVLKLFASLPEYTRQYQAALAQYNQVTLNQWYCHGCGSTF